MDKKETQFTSTELQTLAELIFPNWQKLPSLEELDKRYPKRELPFGAIVNRVAPSPTGMMHIGGLYVALVNRRLAKQTQGVFFLRIEDTDQERAVVGAYETIVNSLADYGLSPDEGPMHNSDGEIVEEGNYGPYVQTSRKEIYHACAFDMLKRGAIYPCFMTKEELDKQREEQQKLEVRTGVYKEWALGRYLSFQEIESKIKAGIPYVLRLRALGEIDKTISWEDEIRGTLTVPENIVDTVLIKSDGIPTYHFAHLVDDHFMRTTHIIRADEWISSVPLHLQLFSAMGWEPPFYTHVSAIQKMAETGKRKLSKRHDPEASVSYYWENGFPRQAVIEYLLNLANSEFEDWRRVNPTSDYTEFRISLGKMGQAGPLADLIKLESISRDILSRMPIEALYKVSYAWAFTYDKELAEEMAKDPLYSQRALDIERDSEKGAKRLSTLKDLRPQLAPFFDHFLPPANELPFPDNVKAEDRKAILELVKERFKDSDPPEQFFENLKLISAELGFAGAVKDFKKNPQMYKGHVGDVASIVRVAMFGSTRSPDLGQVLKVLGNQTVVNRCNRAISVN
ncbi:MAG: glutamate--tRNA ligase [Acidobacteria bacterium]|nr:glutamate--tRNA ligase [Acidobacteriota bacterium]